MDTMDQTSYKRILNKLIDLIANGTLKPNEKIYSENRLAMLLNIPRAQVREVYTALRILGILYGKQGEGTYFKPSTFEHETEILYLMTLMDNSRFEDIISMRKILETGAVELASINRQESHLSDMQEYLKIMENTNDPLAIAKHDAMFHSKIAEASCNPLVRSLHKIVYGYVSRIAKDHWRLIIEKEQKQARNLFYAQHKNILKAIENKQAAAAKEEMIHHMDHLIENILSNREALQLSNIHNHLYD